MAEWWKPTYWVVFFRDQKKNFTQTKSYINTQTTNWYNHSSKYLADQQKIVSDTTDGYKKRVYASIHNRWVDCKTAIKHSPRFAGRMAYRGTAFGIYLGKNFLFHTPPGRWIRWATFGYLGCRALYVYGTGGNQDVVIVKSFWSHGDNDGDGKNLYKISAKKSLTNGRNEIFEVRNSPWYLSFTSTELWAEMNEGERWNITYYGVRYRPWGIYPSVVRGHRISS